MALAALRSRCDEAVGDARWNDDASAIVQLVDAGGWPLDAGISGTTADGRSLVVGYDGEAFLRGLAATNTVSLEKEDGSTCEATFSVARQPGQRRVGTVACR